MNDSPEPAGAEGGSVEGVPLVPVAVDTPNEGFHVDQLTGDSKKLINILLFCVGMFSQK